MEVIRSFFRSSKGSEEPRFPINQQKVEQGAEEVTTLGGIAKNAVGLGQHHQNVQEITRTINKERKKERSRLIQNWKRQEREHKRDLERMEEKYMRRGFSEKRIEQKKREQERAFKRQKQEAYRSFDNSFRQRRREASKQLRDQYRKTRLAA